MEKELQISWLQRTIGGLFIQLGVQQLRNAQTDFTVATSNADKILSVARKLGIQSTELDFSYRYTSWDNWLKIIDVLNPILKSFKWEAQVFDCDNRAELVSSLCALIFRINTCARVYCEVLDATTGVSKYLHWCNIIVDTNGSSYLWDVDQNGMTQKITTNNTIMGVNKYKLISMRIG